MRSGPLGLIACGSGSLPVALLCESKKGMSACEIQRGGVLYLPPKKTTPRHQRNGNGLSFGVHIT
jgi:hypothetical protein